MKLKKILAGALAAVMAVGSMSIAAFAEEETLVSGDYQYEVLEDGTVSITGYLGDDEDVVIPGTIDGKDVTVIGASAFGENENIVTVEIPDSVTKIEFGAFLSCTSLTNIVIPDSVTEIGKSAFFHCPLIEKIVIPDSVTEIGMSAFAFCSSLTEIVISDSVTTIRDGTFYICYSLTQVVIPDSVTEIEQTAFEGCSSLTRVVIPNSVTTIGLQAFARCESLTEIVIPDSVTTIEEAAFGGCSEDLTIYGYAGSYAETYAKENGINFEVIKEDLSKPATPDDDNPLEDKDTGIEISAAEGVLPEGAELTVKVDEKNTIENTVAFDITVTVDGKPADINGNVTVTIPVPDDLKGADTYYVFYQADDGTLTDMKATYKDGVITFTTNHFSTYIVSTINLLDDKNNVDTGITGVAVVAGLAAVAAAAAAISRKRK